MYYNKFIYANKRLFIFSSKFESSRVIIFLIYTNDKQLKQRLCSRSRVQFSSTRFEIKNDTSAQLDEFSTLNLALIHCYIKGCEIDKFARWIYVLELCICITHAISRRRTCSAINIISKLLLNNWIYVDFYRRLFVKNDQVLIIEQV